MGILLSMLIGGLIGAFIGALIGEEEIREQVQEDGGFYGEIVAIQPKTVTIKEIDVEGDVMQYRKLESDDGVDEDLYVGEIIYAYE